MNAASLLASYLKLTSAEQETFDSLHTSINAQLKAGRLAQQELDRLLSGETEEPSNVINATFGSSSNGPSDLVRLFLRQHPSGSARDCKAFAAKVNPEVKMSSVTVMFYKLRGKAA